MAGTSAPVITAQQGNMVADEYENPEIKVPAVGALPTSFTWYKNGEVMEGGAEN